MNELKWIERDGKWLYVRGQASREVAVLTACVSRDRWEGNVWDGYGHRWGVVLPFGPDDSRFNPLGAVAALLGKELYWRGDRAYVLGEEEVLGSVSDMYDREVWFAVGDLAGGTASVDRAKAIVEALVKARGEL